MNITMNKILRRAFSAFSLVGLAVLTGCAAVPLGTPIASMENIQSAKSAGLGPTAVGEFKLATGKDARIDKEVGIRGSTVVSPYGQSLAAYLGETLKTELAAAGLLDAASTTVIKGFLTESTLDAGIGEGKGSLAARFVVVRGSDTRYDKELRVNAVWESSFVGAVAIPTARNEYTLLYRKLVGMLLADPEFRKAVAR